MKKLLFLPLLLIAVFGSAQTIADHAGKTLTYQYTADTTGNTLWIDNVVSPGFIQYEGVTCAPIQTWQVSQVYPLPSSADRTTKDFVLLTSCTTKNGLLYQIKEWGYAYWGGYGRTAGVYYHVQSGTITVSN